MEAAEKDSKKGEERIPRKDSKKGQQNKIDKSLGIKARKQERGKQRFTRIKLVKAGCSTSPVRGITRGRRTVDLTEHRHAGKTLRWSWYIAHFCGVDYVWW